MRGIKSGMIDNIPLGGHVSEGQSSLLYMEAGSEKLNKGLRMQGRTLPVDVIQRTSGLQVLVL